MSYRDPNYRYHGAASHVDPRAFARRQDQRRRDAIATAKARAEADAASEVERAEKVRPIAARKRASA